MTAKISCPGCSKIYSIPSEQLGKKATCKTCGQRFVLQVADSKKTQPPPIPSLKPEQVPEKPAWFQENQKAEAGATQKQTAQQPLEISEFDNDPPDKPKGFFVRMQEKAEAVQQKATMSVTVKFLSGPCDLAVNSFVVLEPDGSDLTVIPQSLRRKTVAYRTPMNAITGINVGSREQVSVAIDDAEPLVFGKAIIGVGKIAERILLWMHQNGVLTDSEFETRNAAVQSAVRDARDERKAKRGAQLPLKYLHGPFGSVKPGTLVFLACEGEELTAEVQVLIKRKEVFCIPLASITGTVIETAERMTFTRLGAGFLLAGPLGALFGGFGFKKKDKLLRLDFDDGGMEASIVFGKGGMSVEKVNAKILDALRDYRKRTGTPSIPTGGTDEPSAGADDITTALEKLAALKEQGILTEEEFTAKKTELLSRM